MKMEYTNAYKLIAIESGSKLNLVFEQSVPVMQHNPDGTIDVKENEYVNVASLQMDIPFARNLAESIIYYTGEALPNKQEEKQ